MYASPIYQSYANPTWENLVNPEQVIGFIRHPGRGIQESTSRTRKAKRNLTRSDNCSRP